MESQDSKVSIILSADNLKTLLDCAAENIRTHHHNLEADQDLERIVNKMVGILSSLENVFETEFFEDLSRCYWSSDEVEGLDAKLDIIENVLEALLHFEFQYKIELKYPALVRCFCDKYMQYMEDHYT